MADSAADALKALAGAGDDQVSVTIMVVDDAQEDGTVNLRSGDGGVFPGISCDSSYLIREEGDVVPVLKHRAGWRVLPPAGKPPTVLTGSDVDDVMRIGDMDDYVKVGDSEQTTLEWGASSPPAGMREASKVFVAENKIYAQLSTPATPPPPKPRPKHYKSVPVAPVNDANYSQGHRKHTVNGGHPIQGGYRSYPNNVGGWFYGSKVTAESSGRPVAGMRFRLVRRATGGRSGGVRPRLFLISNGSAPYKTPSVGRTWSPGKALGWGSGYTYDLPGWMVAALENGSAKGIGCSGPNGNTYYALYTAGSGTLTVYFN